MRRPLLLPSLRSRWRAARAVSRLVALAVVLPVAALTTADTPRKGMVPSSGCSVTTPANPVSVSAPVRVARTTIPMPNPGATCAGTRSNTRRVCGTTTVTGAVSARVSLRAITSARPAARADTRPSAATAATAGDPLLHVTGRPASTAPLASRATAASVRASPSDSTSESGTMVSDATGTCTVTGTLSRAASLRAQM